MRALFLAVLFTLVPAAAFAQTIDKAYQKEFTYLQAQKSALTARLAELERENRASSNANQAELSAVQNRLVALQLEGDALQDQLAELERQALRADDQSESLAALFEQASSSLERFEIAVAPPKAEPTADEVRAVFAAAMPALEQAGQVRTAPGEFFLRSGERTTGDVTRVGRIAAFGHVSGGAIPLAPAGEGRLKAWGEVGQPGVFLFESLDKAVEEKAEKTWLDTVQAGGMIAWVIVALGFFALLLVAWRTIALFLARTPGDFLEEVIRLVAVGRYAEARRLADARHGALARVVKRTIEVLPEQREVADDAIAHAILTEQPHLDRFGTAITVAAAVAPLLGLLGTVTGMIATFDIITEFGTGDPKMLSSGISEALITTQLGLMVAIPALLVGNLLNARAASLLDDLEHAALRVLSAARAEHGGKFEPASAPAPTEVGLPELT